MSAATLPSTLNNSRAFRSKLEQSPSIKMLGAVLIGAVPALALAIVVARQGTGHPAVLPLAGIVFIINAAIVYQDLRNGIALFIIAAALSPKLPGFYKNLRVEDFVFFAVFGLWLTRQAGAQSLRALRSPIVAPFLALTLFSLLSTLYGMGMGIIKDPVYSAFLQFKRVEYFLIFWVVATTIKSEQWLRLMLLLFVASGGGAAVYGFMTQSEDVGSAVSETRVMGPEGENYNTLSGYLVVCIGAGLAMLPEFRRPLQRALILASVGVAAMGVMFSFSKEGLIMLMVALAYFGFTRYKGMLIVGAVGFSLALVAVPDVRDNLSMTFHQIQISKEDDPGANSLTARYQAWEYRWNAFFLQQPVLGNGVGSVRLSVDNEYLLRACEAGVVGFGIFLWWLASIGQQVARLTRRPGLSRTLGYGLASGFTGLLVQGTVACCFTSIRTMEAFWYLLGLVTAASFIQQRQAKEAAEEAERQARSAAERPLHQRRRIPSVGW